MAALGLAHEPPGPRRRERHPLRRRGRPGPGPAHGRRPRRPVQDRALGEGGDRPGRPDRRRGGPGGRPDLAPLRRPPVGPARRTRRGGSPPRPRPSPRDRWSSPTRSRPPPRSHPSRCSGRPTTDALSPGRRVREGSRPERRGHRHRAAGLGGSHPGRPHPAPGAGRHRAGRLRRRPWERAGRAAVLGGLLRRGHQPRQPAGRCGGGVHGGHRPPTGGRGPGLGVGPRGPAPGPPLPPPRPRPGDWPSARGRPSRSDRPGPARPSPRRSTAAWPEGRSRRPQPAAGGAVDAPLLAGADGPPAPFSASTRTSAPPTRPAAS